MADVRQLFSEAGQAPKISWVQDIERKWWAIFYNGNRVFLAEPTKLHRMFANIEQGYLQRSSHRNTVVC